MSINHLETVKMYLTSSFSSACVWGEVGEERKRHGRKMLPAQMSGNYQSRTWEAEMAWMKPQPWNGKLSVFDKLKD